MNIDDDQIVTADESVVESIVQVDESHIDLFDATRPEVVIVDDSDSLIVGVDEELVTIFDASQTQVIEVGAAGPQGPAGAAAGNVTKTASVAIGGHRVVILNGDDEAEYADNQVLAHRSLVFGLTLNAASAGDDLEIATSGEVTELSWSWTAQAPIFLGANGLLTQTVPTSPAVFSRIVAFAVNATKIVVGLREPIAIV